MKKTFAAALLALSTLSMGQVSFDNVSTTTDVQNYINQAISLECPSLYGEDLQLVKLEADVLDQGMETEYAATISVNGSEELILKFDENPRGPGFVFDEIEAPKSLRCK